MAQSRSGAFRLGRVAGIDLFLHWSWLLVAYFEISQRPNAPNAYTSQAWNVIEYLALFGIVILHEFGHALACRQVGGTADQIMLWPLGGVAYVSPPPRPGAVLWSIAAGPLVNAALVPVTVGAYLLAARFGLDDKSPDAVLFLYNIGLINAGLLIFNMLPIYPLDGGQILQSLLWFVLGRANSLYVVSALGLIVGLGLIGLSIWGQNLWFLLVSIFIAARCWSGFQQARMLSRMIGGRRHEELACPVCRAPPPYGNFWTCGKCRTKFDIFAYQGACPECSQRFNDVQCPHCHERRPIAEWVPGGPVHTAES